VVGSWVVATCATLGPAYADGPVPIVGQPPPAAVSPPSPATAGTQSAEAERDVPFDPKGFGKPSPQATKLVLRVEQQCYASPLSREGMTPHDEARCNVAIARLSSMGVAAVPAIVDRLNQRDAIEHYYGRSRLYYVLGRLADQRVRQVMVDGLVWMTVHHESDFVQDLGSMEVALKEAYGGVPMRRAHWAQDVAVDARSEQEQRTAQWVAHAARYRGKTRGYVIADMMGRARRELASADAATAYEAVASLMQFAPREAGRAATAYAAREGLDGEQRSAFEALVSESEWRSQPGYPNMISF
jgi:hypothetical protein